MTLDGSVTPWAGGTPDAGETFVWGRCRETAAALLAAAREAGVDPNSVRTTRDGYIVPDVVYDTMQDNKQQTGL